MKLDGRDLRLELSGSDVRLLQTELAQIGLTVPDDERIRAFFGPRTQEAVVRFQREHELEPSGVVDAETAKAMNEVVDAGAYTVDGTVTSPDRAGVGGLRIGIVDKNAGADGDVLLAETSTDERGRYLVRFVAVLGEGRKDKLDLQAQVYLGETCLAASDVRYNASNRETLDVRLPADSDALPSEYETLTAALARQHDGKLADLEESDKPDECDTRQDITYLANKTGWDARAVALAALADQFSEHRVGRAGVGLQPAFYYALFRAGLPTAAETLYQADAKAAEEVWRQAVGQGVIPKALEGDIPAAVELFQSLSAERALGSRAMSGASTLGEMLRLAFGEDVDRQQQFADLYARHRGDPDTLWDKAREAFGDEMAGRLELDGQLGYLTLNNAPLMSRLHEAEAQNRLASTLDLAQRGYSRAEKWSQLLGEQVPDQIPGATPDEKRAKYAELLASQVRVTFPTAVVAEMVRSGEFVLDAADDVRDGVHAFLTEHQGTFEIGRQPIEQYIAQNRLGDAVRPVVRDQVKRLQRVYQITPNDQAMTVLLENKLDSAYRVIRYNEAAFVRSFQDELGGEEIARLTHAKARQVHNAVLNLATSYLVAATAPGIGAHSAPKFLDSKPAGPDPAAMHQDDLVANAGDVIAYPTLESLFGSMDFCACEHCRSILSPAAYLVNLLQFLDSDDDVWAKTLADWHSTHGNAHYPFADQADWNMFKDDWSAFHPGEPLPNTELSPFQVLAERRPDIQHLLLTCENTNTPLPYIDVVNEALEYYVTHSLSLAGYQGYSTDDTVSAGELLASPQNVFDNAYGVLRAERFPPPLPFDRSLEALRRYFDSFDLPLPEAMETLRLDDALERADDAGYGWRDILMEQLKLSRAEHALLTDRGLTLQQLYGYDPSTPLDNVLHDLSNVKWFARRVDVAYSDVIDILRTSFINPNAVLIPRLERLGMPFSTLKGLKEGTITGQWFDDHLPAGLDPAEYGGTEYEDIKNWVLDETNFARIMGLITVANPVDEAALCSFEHLEFRYVEVSVTLRPIEFVKLSRFIRLWKKLGWTVEETDRVITALYPTADLPSGADEVDDLEHLDAGFLVLLPRLGVVSQLMSRLKVRPHRDLSGLLACWSPIDTSGPNSLYRKMFLRPAPSEQGEAFGDDPYGNFLNDDDAKLRDHAEALRAAFGLTADEFSQIFDAAGFDANTALTLENISAIYRRGWLARKLRLSVREFLLLTRFAGLDPFATPDPPNPQIVRLLGLVEALKSAALKPAEALYLIWNQDISGKSAPEGAEVMGFARTLRAEFASIESQFALVDDPNGEIARARMTLVYGVDATDFFFGLIGETLSVDTPYTPEDAQEQILLEQVLAAGQGRVSYDDFGEQLTYAGVLNTETRDALKAVAGPSDALKSAVDDLHVKSQSAVTWFFARYPELLDAYTNYADPASADLPEERRKALLATVLPELKRRRKRQQAIAAITAATGVERAFAQAVLDEVTVLHSGGDTKAPALDDLIVVEAPGLTAQFYWSDTATGTVDHSEDPAPNLAYSAGSGNELPTNPNEGAPLSGVWGGYLQIPETDSYKLRIETDVGAAVTVTLDGQPVVLAESEATWTSPEILLTAGTLAQLTLKVEQLTSVLTVGWERRGHGREVIPPDYLYPAAAVDHLRGTYVRFLKAASLAAGLKLTAREIAHLAASPDYQIDAADDQIEKQGWLNFLAVAASPDEATAHQLRVRLDALLDFARIKSALAPGDERLISVLEHPDATLPSGDSLLLSLTRWEADSLGELLTRFFHDTSTDPLIHLDSFRRIYDAFALVAAAGVSAPALAGATTNNPDTSTVDAFQSALRARYDADDWLDVVRPINDELRELQRDALVAHILQKFALDPDTSHIDTPDKLFEYFLMDVQMDPCMETSRIRHALSSVQLFIERCLMNLEPRVAASAINAKRWEAMKRYRVWEANRKVFLWPENWLEPELRDDQSPFFKEAMGELLQGDITEDAAAKALRNYLSKLEQVAKLEPCGIYYDEAKPGENGDVVHVVARTAGAHRKYYYRRYEYSYWTPWEQIPLEIEDNPVIPAVWRNRLFLFWLRILQEAPVSPSSQQLVSKPSVDQETELGSANLGQLKTDAREEATAKTHVAVRAVLCWSEYFNGKWQSAKTSDLGQPVTLSAHALDRSTCRLGVVPATDLDPDNPPLRVGILTFEGGDEEAAYLLYNTHSLPVPQERSLPYLYLERPRYIIPQEFQADPSLLTIRYSDPASGSLQLQFRILKHLLPVKTIEPYQYPLLHPRAAPFLFADSRHVFYVTTREVVLPKSKGYGVALKPHAHSLAPVKVLTKAIPDKGGPVMSQPWLSVTNEDSLHRVISTNDGFAVMLATSEMVHYGEVQLGPVGAVSADASEES